MTQIIKRIKNVFLFLYDTLGFTGRGLLPHPTETGTNGRYQTQTGDLLKPFSR